MKTSFNEVIILSLLYISVSIFLTGCSSKTSDFPNSENKVLDHLLKKAPVTTIDLDHFPVDTLIVKGKNILGRKSDPSIHPSVLLGRAVGLIKIGDTIYVADEQENCIWAMNTKGVWIRKIGRHGKGPGEFGHSGPGGIYKNSKYVYTSDETNLKIQVYDHRLNYKYFFRPPLLPAISLNGIHDIGVTDSSLYLPLTALINKHLDKLIQLREANPPFAVMDSIFTPFIPSTSNIYNHYLIDSNRNGQMALAFKGLPYVFFLNKDHHLMQTLYLKTTKYSHLKHAPIESTRKLTKRKIEVDGFFYDLLFMKNGSLLVYTANFNLYWLVRDGKSYRLKKVFHPVKYYWNTKQRKMRPHRVPISDMILENDTLYTCSIFQKYIYRFDLKGL